MSFSFSSFLDPQFWLGALGGTAKVAAGTLGMAGLGALAGPAVASGAGSEAAGLGLLSEFGSAAAGSAGAFGGAGGAAGYLAAPAFGALQEVGGGIPFSPTTTQGPTFGALQEVGGGGFLGGGGPSIGSTAAPAITSAGAVPSPIAPVIGAGAGAGAATGLSNIGPGGFPASPTASVASDLAATATTAAPEAGGALGGITGFLKDNYKWLLPAAGFAGDLFTTGQEISSQQGALDAQRQAFADAQTKYFEDFQGQQEDYLDVFKGATEWSTDDRSDMMRAIMGIYSGQATDAKKRAADRAAAGGRGGGSYGARAFEIEQAGREASAQALAGTFGPSGAVPSTSAFFPNASAYFPNLPVETGRNVGSEVLGDWLQMGGSAATMYFLQNLLK